VEADAPAYAGASAWRALVPAARAPDFLRGVESHLWLLPGAHVVHYPLRDGEFVNVVIILAETAPASTVAARSGAEVAGLLKGYRAAPALCALIGGAETYRYWPLYARPPLTRWGHGSVTLLGDAAHPMVPFLAQGAAQAIEDADALGRAFSTTPDAPVARIFADYAQARCARASAVARASARQGHIDHLRGPLAAARDLAIRALGGDALLRRNAWLYRGETPE
jgi:salicylate hydroxylase